MLLPFASKATLKVLHIRQSAPDLVRCPSWALIPSLTASRAKGHALSESGRALSESGRALRDKFRHFAEWIFGPQGIKSLRVVAFGDFAHGGQRPQDNVILCKSTGGKESFQLLGKHEAQWLDVLEEYRNALEACPAEGILDYR